MTRDSLTPQLTLLRGTRLPLSCLDCRQACQKPCARRLDIISHTCTDLPASVQLSTTRRCLNPQRLSAHRTRATSSTWNRMLSPVLEGVREGSLCLFVPMDLPAEPNKLSSLLCAATHLCYRPANSPAML